MLSLNNRDSMVGGNRNRIIYELHSGGYFNECHIEIYGTKVVPRYFRP